MMFEARETEVVAEGHQKVVVGIVVRPEQLVGLTYQRTVRFDLLRRGR